MDGRNIILKSVQSIQSEGSIERAGDGVDACIAAAWNEAQRYQEGRAGDVLAHLEYQRNQLSILISNLKSLPE